MCKNSHLDGTEAEETDFTAMQRADCGGSSRVAKSLLGKRFMNMFVSELFPPPYSELMFNTWCSDIWKFPSRGKITQVFLPGKISRISEVDTPNP